MTTKGCPFPQDTESEMRAGWLIKGFPQLEVIEKVTRSTSGQAFPVFYWSKLQDFGQAQSKLSNLLRDRLPSYPDDFSGTSRVR